MLEPKLNTRNTRYMYNFILYYGLQSLGFFQQQMNRETTPQENQISM
jgi:hypothetical protein